MKINFILPGSPLRKAVYSLMKAVVPCWCTLFYRFEVRGQDNIPHDGPAIIVPKHQHWTDIPFIGLAFYNKQLHYMAKQELFTLPLISNFLVALGGIPLDRQAPIKSMDSFRYLAYLLRQGQGVVIFPEGTYYRGVMGRGKSRLISMVLSLQERDKYPAPIPFIPVGIIYGGEKVRQTVKVTIGAPLYSPQATDAKAFTGTIMEAIARLSEMDRAG